jgi:hypothetical protein
LRISSSRFTGKISRAISAICESPVSRVKGFYLAVLKGIRDGLNIPKF